VNYRKHYNELMKRGAARFDGTSLIKARRSIPFFVERHRILPGCIGGKYVAGNVAWLTPEEHFLAHELLVKLYPTNAKMIHALFSMSNGNGKMTNKQFGWIRSKYIESKIGHDVTIETREKIRKSLKAYFASIPKKPKKARKPLAKIPILLEIDNTIVECETMRQAFREYGIDVGAVRYSIKTQKAATSRGIQFQAWYQ
jgi:hypothetical protein